MVRTGDRFLRQPNGVVCVSGGVVVTPVGPQDVVSAGLVTRIYTCRTAQGIVQISKLRGEAAQLLAIKPNPSN